MKKVITTEGQFCNWFLQAVHDAVFHKKRIFFSEETVTSERYTNPQNNTHWNCI
jgi:hypothetical protein